MKANLEYDNIIKDKEDLLSQLESLKQEAIYMMKSVVNDCQNVFNRDFHALSIVIRFIEEMK